MFKMAVRNPLRLLVPFVTAAVLTAGCAKAPDAEITAAKAEIEKARTAEATVYAPEAYAMLEESQKALDRELQVQGGKNFLTRKYDNAKQMADALALKAAEVEKAALENKAAAREEASRLIDSTKSLLLEVQTMIADAPKGKGSALDLQVLKADLKTMETTLDQAGQSFEKEEYLDAQKAARLAMTAGMSVKSDLGAAMQMKAGSRKATTKP